MNSEIITLPPDWRGSDGIAVDTAPCKYVWHLGIRWSIPSVSEFLGVSSSLMSEYYDAFGKDAPEKLLQGVPVTEALDSSRKAKKAITDELASLAREHGIPYNTVKYRYDKGLRGDKLLKRKAEWND